MTADHVGTLIESGPPPAAWPLPIPVAILTGEGESMPARRRPSGRLYRRCQECGAARAASELEVIVNRGGVGRQYRCPSCGYVAPHWAFTEVEPPDGGGGPNAPQPGDTS